jgi:hypothetical protein
MRREIARAVCLVSVVLATAGAAAAFPTPRIDYAPSRYTCRSTATPPVVDGDLGDPAWSDAAWTQPFVDIEGSLKPAPRFATRVKMAWDQRYFYVAARMEEPDLWATYEQRDAVIYHENDFEVFIDPDGDTHEYYELEINAINTVWDLLLLKPYRDGGPAVNAWDIAGLRTAVKLDGTLNEPSDRDAGWTVEIAMPWAVLGECAHRPSPPRNGDRWWVNFSRVEWRRDVVDGRYVKTMDTVTGKDLPEDNWVWSPQGLVAMHYPEMWGLVTFTKAEGSVAAYDGSGPDRPPAADSTVVPSTDQVAAEAARWALRQIYYAQMESMERHGRYQASLEALSLALPSTVVVTLQTWMDGYEAILPLPDGTGSFHIRDDGRIRLVETR